MKKIGGNLYILTNWADGQMYICTYICMYIFTDGRMDGQTYVSTYVCMYGWKDRQTDGWTSWPCFGALLFLSFFPPSLIHGRLMIRVQLLFLSFYCDLFSCFFLFLFYFSQKIFVIRSQVSDRIRGAKRKLFFFNFLLFLCKYKRNFFMRGTRFLRESQIPE